MHIFTPLFTIFMLIIGGYVAKRIGFLKQKQSKMFLDFAITFALPCLIFDRIYHLNFDFSLIIYIFLGLFCSLIAGLVAITIGKIMGFSKATIASIFLLSSFGNTLFIGMPIISGIYENPQYIGEVILYDAIATNLPIAFIAPFVISLVNNQKINIFQVIKKIITFPPFIAIILGFALKPIPLPEFIFAPIVTFGNSATAIALFAIGLSLGFRSIKNVYKSTIIVVLAKTILTPLIFITIATLFNLKFESSLIIAILESATPTMVLAVVIVIKEKLDSNLAVSSITFGILFSFVSIPCFVYFLL